MTVPLPSWGTTSTHRGGAEPPAQEDEPAVAAAATVRTRSSPSKKSTLHDDDDDEATPLCPPPVPAPRLSFSYYYYFSRSIRMRSWSAPPYASTTTTTTSTSAFHNNATLQRQYQRQRQRRQKQLDRTCLLLSDVFQRRHWNKQSWWHRRRRRALSWAVVVLGILGTVVLWGYHHHHRRAWGWLRRPPSLPAQYNIPNSNNNSNNNNHLSPAVVERSARIHTIPQTQTTTASRQQPLGGEQPNQGVPTRTPDGTQRMDRSTPKERRDAEIDPEDSAAGPAWFLQDYVHFHQTHVRPALPDANRRPNNGGPSSYYYQLEPPTTTRYLRWTCRSSSCGGLGDRLNGIVQTFFMAYCTDRVFLIDNHHHHRAIPLQPTPWVPWMVERLPPAERQLSLLDDRNLTLLRDPSPLLLHDDDDTWRGVDVQTNLWMAQTNAQTPCWRDKQLSHVTPLEFYRAAVALLFVVPSEWQRATESLRQQAGLGATWIGVHVRTGTLDNGTAAVRHNNATEWQQFIQCAHNLQRALMESSCRPATVDVYLAADDARVKTFLLEDQAIHDNTTATTTMNIKTIRDWNVGHLDQNHNDELAAGAAWTEWNLLRQSLCLVMSHSKFSQTAADLASPHGCAVSFDDCDATAVERAVRHVTLCGAEEHG